METGAACRYIQRAAITPIYFRLARGEHSRWHRVTSDEIWHCCEGEPLELLWADPAGDRCERAVLGLVGDGRRPVGPGFDFADFSMLQEHPADADRLRARFPEFADLL